MYIHTRAPLYIKIMSLAVWQICCCHHQKGSTPTNLKPDAEPKPNPPDTHLNDVVLHCRWLTAAQDGEQLIGGYEIETRKNATLRVQIFV